MQIGKMEVIGALKWFGKMMHAKKQNKQNLNSDFNGTVHFTNSVLWRKYHTKNEQKTAKGTEDSSQTKNK